MKTKFLLFITVLTFQFGFSQEPVRVANAAIDTVKTKALDVEKDAKANEKAERERLKAEKEKIEAEKKELEKVEKEKKMLKKF